MAYYRADKEKYFENGYIKDVEGRNLDDWTLKCLKDGSMHKACEETLEFLKKNYK